MYNPSASSSKSFLKQGKDNEENRISAKFIVDNLPPLQKQKNNRHKDIVPMMQKPQQISIIKDVKQVKNERYLYIPKTLFPVLKQIEADPPNIPGFKISYLKEVIHLVATRIEEDGYSYLKMEYLRNVNYLVKYYIKYLLDQGIIQRTKFFNRGFKSYGYKFTEAHNGKCLRTPLRDPVLFWKIRKVYAKLNQKKENNHYPAQCRLIESLTIDPEAREYAEANYKGEQLKYALGAIINIENGDFFHKEDDTGGRFHSNITNLPKELRQFIRVNDRPLIANVDIKNSQPYFSIMVLTNPGKLSYFAKSNNLRMMLKYLQTSENEDVKRYKNDVINGQLYEILWDEYYKRGLKYYDEDLRKWLKYPDRKAIKANDVELFDRVRGYVKKSVLKTLYDVNRDTMTGTRKAFEDLYLTVHQLFSLVRGNSAGNRFENYKRFSILMQIIESTVILKRVLRRVYNENITALTIHDSLIVTDNPETVKRIMGEQLEKFVGFKPEIEIEFFSPKLPFNH